jgi:hypothetical protein
MLLISPLSFVNRTQGRHTFPLTSIGLLNIGMVIVEAIPIAITVSITAK